VSGDGRQPPRHRLQLGSRAYQGSEPAGFPFGGMIAQEIIAQARELARRLFLLRHRAARPPIMSTKQKSAEIFAGVYDPRSTYGLRLNSRRRFKPARVSPFWGTQAARKDSALPRLSEGRADGGRSAKPSAKYVAPAEKRFSTI